jgi:hypothetical protein
VAPRAEYAESTAALETAIDSFANQYHDPEDFNKPWYDIFLAARSLSTDYYTIVILAGKVNCTARTKIIELLEQARDTIPRDVKAAFHQQIEGWIKDALGLPREIMEIEQDEDFPN